MAFTKLTPDFVTDAAGNPKAAVIPISQWHSLLKERAKLSATAKAKAKIKSDLTAALLEVKSAEKGQKHLPSLDEVLREL